MTLLPVGSESMVDASNELLLFVGLQEGRVIFLEYRLL